VPVAVQVVAGVLVLVPQALNTHHQVLLISVVPMMHHTLLVEVSVLVLVLVLVKVVTHHTQVVLVSVLVLVLVLAKAAMHHTQVELVSAHQVVHHPKYNMLVMLKVSLLTQTHK
jgi:hypothetical protein